jgi:flagellar hook-length control protein FliK
MMLPAGLVSLPSANSSGLLSSPGDSLPGVGPKLDFRTVQNLLAALLAEWGMAAAAATHASAQSKESAATANSNAGAVLPIPGSTLQPATMTAVGSKPAVLNGMGAQAGGGAVGELFVQAAAEGKLPVALATGPSSQSSTASNADPTGLHAFMPPMTPIELASQPKSGSSNPSGSKSVPGADLFKGQPGTEVLPGTHGGPDTSATVSRAANQLAATGPTAAAGASALSESQNQESRKQKPDPGSSNMPDVDKPSAVWTGGAVPSGRTPAAAADQVGSEILARMQHMGPEGRTDFHFQLQPPELGLVRIHLTATDGQVSARLVVREAGTRQLLQSQMDTLMQRLSHAGVALGRFDVSQDGAGFQERWENPRPASAAVRVTTAAVATPGEPAAKSVPATGLIDVVA